MMKYLAVLVCISSIWAADLPLEYAQRRPEVAPRTLSESILAEEPEGPFEYFGEPEEAVVDEHFLVRRSIQRPEAEGPFVHIRPPKPFLPQEVEEKPDVYGFRRVRRSWQGGAPQFPGSKPGGNAGVDISRQGQDTHATVNAQHGTDRYEVGGQWSKVVRGPNKAKPEWNVHGAVKW